MEDTTKSKALTRTVALGGASAGLYFLLWLFEEPLIKSTGQGGWFFVIPIAIAFLFSWIHGSFTGLFWDVLGVKAKSVKK
jgi:hypothetical protein